MKYSCLIFSEGGKDKKFLMALIPLLEEYHAKKWIFIYDNASGSSPEIILKQCQNIPFVDSYVLVMCFIDQDKLKSDYPKTWEKEKTRIEKEYSNFIIIWQIDNAEEEYKRVLGNLPYGKHRINKIAREKIVEFKNSDFWNRILKHIKDKERELEK
ncbi:MAG: hypothetical protein WCT22_05745 [Patescibacteria group bacterium]